MNQIDLTIPPRDADIGGTRHNHVRIYYLEITFF